MPLDFAPGKALPSFRPLVKIMPVQHDGRDAFLVMDPQEGIIDHQVVLPPLAFAVAAFLDGRRDLAGVRRALEENLPGLQIEDHEIEGVVRDLDAHYLLESERLLVRRCQIQAEFLALPTRPARFVKGTPEEVRKELDDLYDSASGAGRPGPPEPDNLLAVVAPHIDFERGGTCYTFAYRQVAERSDADLYVILAVAHLAPPTPFILTEKDYETALGTVPTDREVVAALRKRLGEGPFDYEAAHRCEHSAEFQAVLLRHARPSAAFTIVPVLCSSFESLCGTASPSTVPLVEDFVGAMGEAVRGRRVCYVAGVDLSHVGPAFGDDVKIDQRLIRWMVAEDERCLAACAEGNAEGFWDAVMADGNRRHVCGLSATYTLLRLIGDACGEVLKYGWALDPEGGIVSFASMAFRPRSRIILP